MAGRRKRGTGRSLLMAMLVVLGVFGVGFALHGQSLSSFMALLIDGYRFSPLYVGFAAFIALFIKFRFARHAPEPRARALLTMKHLNEMDWKQFELMCLEYYKALGYKAWMTQPGADGGIDVIFERKRGQRSYVQCKAWSSQVGVKSIREFFGVMAADGIKHGVFIATNGYTQEALRFAEGKSLELLDGPQLIAAIAKLPKTAHRKVAAHAKGRDVKVPTCPSCDVKMVQRRDSNNASIWGCVNAPRCRRVFKVKS